MKRRFRLGKLLWLMPLFALLTACGGGGGGGGEPAPPGTPTGVWNNPAHTWSNAKWGP
jgi:hypothetical protein